MLKSLATAALHRAASSLVMAAESRRDTYRNVITYKFFIAE